MAVNFRLAYNDGLDIVDLFPKSNVMSIIDNTNAMKYSTIDVVIPAPTTEVMTQTIAITTTTAQVNAPVYMFLNSTGEQAEIDYSTITQFSIENNQLIITRLYNWPEESIDVTLLFKEVS